jgi:ABC-type Fe3+ transport system permease subunit
VKARYFTPLIGFALPSLVIGFGFVIPGSCIEGINNLTLGFLSTVIGASGSYWMGIRAVLSDRTAESAGAGHPARP